MSIPEKKSDMTYVEHDDLDGFEFEEHDDLQEFFEDGDPATGDQHFDISDFKI